MKNYLVVSQCQGKAFRNTRRIASSFMSRLGQDTWQGTLSSEALRIMIQELKRKATRLSCIAVYDVSGRTRQKVIHIGNRSRYIETGEFAFSVHKSSERPLPNPSTQLRLISKVCEMAGLLHDLGKGTVRFQDKLNYGVKHNQGLGDPIRHEVVSVIMASAILEWLGGQDLALLAQNPRLMGQWCDNQLPCELAKLMLAQKDAYSVSCQVAATLNQRMIEPRWAKDELVATSILWLVLAHHRMPQGEQGVAAPLFPGIRYSGRSHLDYFLKCRMDAQDIEDEPLPEDKGFRRYEIKDIRDNLTLYSGTQACPALQPWNDLKWQQKVIAAYKRLKTLSEQAYPELPDNALLVNSEWATGLALMGRTALVYGDYMISHEKVPGRSARTPGEVYANTAKIGERAVYADTLTKHLLGVGERAAQYFQELFIKPEPLIENFPSLSLDERNAMLPGLNKASVDSRYQWQDKVRQTLSKHRSNEPFFGSVMGKTGAGKTRGNVMVMHAMKESVRFTCAIGLRSLVAQTHQAYQEPFIGLTEENLAILVGESIGSASKVNQEVQGTGNDLELDASGLLGDYVIEGSNVFDHPLSTLYDTHKQRSMLTQPVQVMTVDHIAPGASLGRSSELKLLLHLMATDIILDEIDDYPVESQAALMRMAFISGVFGRSFLLSSATATPVIQKAFFEAWLAGHKQGRVLFQGQNRSQSPKAVLVSHVKGHEALITHADAFDRDCAEFICAVAQEARGNARHRVELIPIKEKMAMNSPKSLVGLFDTKGLSVTQHTDLVDSILKFHGTFHVEEGGTRVSSGFVRLNNVKNAQRLALFLNQHKTDNALIVPICYHAKMLAYERIQAEALLLSLNCRKDKEGVSGEQRILYHPTVRAAICQAQSKGMKNVVFVLCTTSIIEVGRDHDYDWAILEPSSTRSLVQSCGRVWRHRNKALPDGLANIGVLETNILSSLGGMKKNPYVWVRHGIEDTRFPRDGRPVVSLTLPVSKFGWGSLDALGIDRDRLTQSNGNLSELVVPLNKASTIWRNMIKADGGLVHAGLCLEIPDKAVNAFMSAMELASQQIHLSGTGDAMFAMTYPPGKQYSDLAPARLCSHHADHRRLRDPNTTITLEYDAKHKGLDDFGHPKQRGWIGTNQAGDEISDSNGLPLQILLGEVGSGNLWKPGTLEAFLESGASSRRVAKLAIRTDECREIGKYRYIFGIGWIRDYW